MKALPLQTRFIYKVGYRVHERSDDGSCQHYHDFTDTTIYKDEMLDGGEWQCDKCGEAFVPNGGKPIYSTESGKPEPGDLFWAEWYSEDCYWDNHKGPHLIAVCPNGTHWNIDSRASNCTMPEDRLHRCWVRHGDPEKGEIHVDKNGHTCKAGGGSIWVDQGTDKEYHGMLHHSKFT